MAHSAPHPAGRHGTSRNRFAPDAPMLLEQGLRDMVFSGWFGFLLPGKAPADVVQRADAALRIALADEQTVDGPAVMGLDARSSSPAELAALLDADTHRRGPIAKATGFTAES